MTLATTTSRTTYTGTGSTGPFAYPFKINVETHLLVTKRSSTFVETILAWPADFTVTGVGNAAGGTITLTTALATGNTLFIRRKPPLTQTTSIRNQGAYFPQLHEDEFDLLVQQLQSLSDAVDRCAKLKETITGGAALTELEPTNGSAITGTGTGFTMSPISAGAVALPGQGRTTTTLSAYLLNNAVYNIKDYGAIVNGVADDTNAIIATVAAAALALGGTILIPGFAKTTATITITAPDITVVSWGTSGGIVPATATFNLFTLGPLAHRTKFFNMWFKGAGADQTTAQYAIWTNALAAPDDVEIAGCVLGNYSLAGPSLNDGIKIDGGNNWSIHNCTFRYFYLDVSGTGYGILCGTTNKLHAYENNFFGNIAGLRGRHAVYLSGGCTYCDIHDNVVEGYLEDAFPIFSYNYQTQNTGNRIHNNHIIGGGEGSAESGAITISGNSSRNVIENNYIDGFNGFGIMVDAIGYLASTNQNVVRGNFIRNVKWAGVMNYGAQGTLIQDNEIQDVSQLGAGNYPGVYMRTSGTQVSDKVTVKGNRCRGTLISAGLDCFDALQTNIRIEDNFFPDGTVSKLQNCGTAVGQNLDFGLAPISGDQGDVSLTLRVGRDQEVALFASNLTVNRTVTLDTVGVYTGAHFRILRTGLGAFTLAVGALKTIPNSTAAYVDVMYNGAAWVLTGYGTL